MPNRMLRDWTASYKTNALSAYAERFFTRLIMKVDDYGCFHADPRLLKANLFPLLLDSVREADLLRWMTECQKAGLIVLYEYEGKRYLQISDFRQRLDKARSKYPIPSGNEIPVIVNDFPSELEVENEVEAEKNEAIASATITLSPVFFDPDKQLKHYFDKLELPEDAKSAWTVVKDWIIDKKPQFVEPYVTAWNIFASFYDWPVVKKVTEKRRQKFKVRIKESAFDFFEILNHAKRSEFLKSGSWFGFDWIIENESNYLKIIEGNYK